GVGNTSFHVTFYVASAPSATTLTVAQNGGAASSGGGTVTTNNIGGCVTGGALYDATQFAAGYRGNFFYGDYNTGRVVRATIDPGSNAVTSNEIWADGMTGQVDVAVGPDGALYYVGNTSGRIARTVYKATAQGLVVS